MENTTNSQPMPNTENQFSNAYLILRQSIGWLGILMPFMLVFGTLVFGCFALQPSISHYYYSTMHLVFVGVLSALGTLLIFYRGKADSKVAKLENKVSNIAGLAAFGVAAFPTEFSGFVCEADCKAIDYYASNPATLGSIHYGFAGILFVCFFIFCNKIFQHSDEGDKVNSSEERRKLVKRRKIYLVNGWTILISILAIIAFHKFFPDLAQKFRTTFVFETIALWSFGNSWIVKGSKYLAESKNSFIKSLVKPIRVVE
jgi:hypothetical protein